MGINKFQLKALFNGLVLLDLTEYLGTERDRKKQLMKKPEVLNSHETSP